jgi:hypothetical protein
LRSVRRYNRGIKPEDTTETCWPCYPKVFEQLGSTTKELYVDNSVHESCYDAHHWLTKQESVGTFAGGFPLKVLCSFLRRHCARSGEAPLDAPSNAKEWRSMR